MPKRYSKAKRARLKGGERTVGELLVELSEFINLRNAKLLAVSTTLAAIEAAKAGKLTEVSIDAL
jgi:hypothetical protein